MAAGCGVGAGAGAGEGAGAAVGAGAEAGVWLVVVGWLVVAGWLLCSSSEPTRVLRGQDIRRAWVMEKNRWLIKITFMSEELDRFDKTKNSFRSILKMECDCPTPGQ